MTEKDERAVAYAIAETFKQTLAGQVRPGDESFSDVERVVRLLYYNLNPWCTEGSFAFLADIVKRLEEGEH